MNRNSLSLHRHRISLSSIQRLQQELASASQVNRDGIVATLLDDIGPNERHQVFADDTGSELALSLTAQAVRMDHARDTASLRGFLRPLVEGATDTSKANTGVGRRSAHYLMDRTFSRHSRTYGRLAQAAFNLSAAKLLSQFDAHQLPHIARDLLFAGELPYNNYKRNFPDHALSPADFASLLNAGHITFQQYCTAPEVPRENLPDLAYQCLVSGAINFEAFSRMGFALQPAQLYPAFQASILTAQQYLSTPGINPQRTADFILDGYLSFRDGMPYLGFLRLADVDLYVQAEKTDWGEWLAHGQICSEDMTEGVENNLFNLGHAQQFGRNTFSLITELHTQGRIDSENAARLATIHWDSNKPFPDFVRQKILEFQDINTLLANLPLPGAPGSALNPPFLARAAAIWCLAHRRQTTAPLAGPIAPVARAECIICNDAVEDASDLFKLKACSHEASMDIACFYEGLESNGGRRCPDTSCERLLSPDEILDLRSNTVQADATALSHVADFYLTLDDWQQCPTEGCVNAINVAPGERKVLDCRCCSETSTFDIPAELTAVNTRRIRNMTRAKLEELRWLVAGAAATSVDRGTPEDKRPQHECYGCGITTRHTDACMHMICPNPNHGEDPRVPVTTKDWHWVKGFYTGWDYEYREQRYRPWKNSVLGEYGLFGDIPPGAHDVDVVPTLQQNFEAIEKMFFALHPDETEQWQPT